MDELSRKTVLVTGSTHGLGRQLAMELLREGANVIINGRNSQRLEETRQQMGRLGWKAFSVQGDVTNPEDCSRMVRYCIQECGRLDILINNAGTGSNGLFRDTIPEAARKVLEINLLGSIYPTYYALPYIAESRGSIVFISSLAGIHGLPYNFCYSTSKMALTALAQSLRLELAGSGIHTGIIYVGFLQNGPQKRIIGSNGLPVPATVRPEKFTMTMEKASLQIIDSIKKRKAVKVFSVMGKFLYHSNRISPLFVRKVLTFSMQRMKYAYTPGQTI